MKRLSWLVGIAALVLYVLYEFYFALMPNVKIENISGEAIKSVEVTLPSSRLVFGSIYMGETHTIYYSLNQKDGTYLYRFTYGDGSETKGECGYVTSNEIGKSFLLTLRAQRVITCSE